MPFPIHCSLTIPPPGNQGSIPVKNGQFSTPPFSSRSRTQPASCPTGIRVHSTGWGRRSVRLWWRMTGAISPVPQTSFLL